MATKLEERVAALEAKVAQLQGDKLKAATDRAWVDDLYGKFAGDPLFVEAMELGRKYRRAQKPKLKSKRK